MDGWLTLCVLRGMFICVCMPRVNEQNSITKNPVSKVHNVFLYRKKLTTHWSITYEFRNGNCLILYLKVLPSVTLSSRTRQQIISSVKFNIVCFDNMAYLFSLFIRYSILRVINLITQIIGRLCHSPRLRQQMHAHATHRKIDYVTLALSYVIVN